MPGKDPVVDFLYAAYGRRFEKNMKKSPYFYPSVLRKRRRNWTDKQSKWASFFINFWLGVISACDIPDRLKIRLVRCAFGFAGYRPSFCGSPICPFCQAKKAVRAFNALKKLRSTRVLCRVGELKERKKIFRTPWRRKEGERKDFVALRVVHGYFSFGRPRWECKLFFCTAVDEEKKCLSRDQIYEILIKVFAVRMGMLKTTGVNHLFAVQKVRQIELSIGKHNSK